MSQKELTFFNGHVEGPQDIQSAELFTDCEVMIRNNEAFHAEEDINDK
jgi:hypothetical protein